LHAVSVFDPITITAKAKLHILTHAPYYARRFGPLLGPDSERYESYNSNFRLMSILSTRQAPSMDAAHAFARIDRLTHVAAGGWWYSPDHRQYIQAGQAIIDHMNNSSKSRELLGLEANSGAPPGKCSLMLQRKISMTLQQEQFIGRADMPILQTNHGMKYSAT
jgi:hypothetical protein